MTERTNFLYPFIDSDERDVGALLIDLGQSARAKADISRALGLATLELASTQIASAGQSMAARFARDGRLFVFGNGGSSTDAASLASLFSDPPWGIELGALNLVEDSAILTALGNDVGFDLVFSRQLIAHAKPGDIAIGFSTSGNSRNVIQAFEEASRRELLTIAIAGYGGGELALSPHVRHCLVVNADSIHRIQETQAALGFALWQAVQLSLSNTEQQQ